MANRRKTRISRASYALGLLLPLAAGCAFPNGSMQGDPMLGSFNRPIRRTPPPERGGLGLDTPAYDGGARIGATPPDIPTAVENSNGFMSLPNLTVPQLFSQGGAYGPQTDDVMTRRLPAGAMLQSTNADTTRFAALPKMPVHGQGPEAVVARQRAQIGFTSGASIEPGLPDGVKQVRYDAPVEAVRIHSVEEGQNALTGMGARAQRMEQAEGGEWVYSCSYGVKFYEGRSRERTEAVRSVMAQIQRDR